jgi:hypothetical protein
MIPAPKCSQLQTSFQADIIVTVTSRNYLRWHVYSISLLPLTNFHDLRLAQPVSLSGSWGPVGTHRMQTTFKLPEWSSTEGTLWSSGPPNTFWEICHLVSHPQRKSGPCVWCLAQVMALSFPSSSGSARVDLHRSPHETRVFGKWSQTSQSSNPFTEDSQPPNQLLGRQFYFS